MTKIEEKTYEGVDKKPQTAEKLADGQGVDQVTDGIRDSVVGIMKKKQMEQKEFNPFESQDDDLEIQIPDQLPKSNLNNELEVMKAKIHSAEAELEKRVYQYKQDMIKELGIDTMKAESFSLKKKANQETIELLIKFIQDCFEGLYGKGQLAICKERLIRYIILPENEEEKHVYKYDRKIKEVRESSFVKSYDLLQKESLVSTDQRLEVCAEVSLDGTTQEEYQELFDKLKNRFTLSRLLKIFPKDFKPVLNAGEILDFGGSSHHSGDIEGKIIVLPSGRLAVFSNYENNKGNSRKEFLGILKTPLTDPYWSAKHEGWAGEYDDFSEPTKEEVDFLTKKEIEVDEEEIRLLEK